MRNIVEFLKKAILKLLLTVYVIGFFILFKYVEKTNPLYFKPILSILIMLMLFYYLSSLLLYIIFSENNINIPKRLPNFLRC